MNIKKTALWMRDNLQQGIYMVINPFVRMLIKMGVTPNMVTTIGLLGNIAAAAILTWAGYQVASGNPVDYSQLTWAGALIIGFSLFDMLDGQVARLGNMVTRFGAMYDSILDRYCEMFTLGGVAFYLLESGSFWGAVLTFLAIVGSIMVSYVRARGEGVGIVCKMGFMQRPERVVVTSLSILATGIVGQSIDASSSFCPDIILIIAMGFIALFANLTAIARINYCRREFKNNNTLS